jgi:hypothetical protein
MKILVVGHLLIEGQESLPGSPGEAYGGIYRAVRTLAALAGKSDVIVPVFCVHESDAEQLLNDLKLLPRVDTSSVYTVDVHSPRVSQPQGKRDRGEGLHQPHPPIPFARIKPHLGADGILLNMVSGNDLTLDTLDGIRMAVRPRAVPIHFDYHNLTLGFAAGGKRRRQPLEEWRRWAFMLDTVQLNEEEIAGLTLEGLGEQQTAGHLLTLGVKGVLVTRREREVTVYRNERKHVVRHDIVVENRAGLMSTLGCEDVFGASFLYHYASSGDLLASAEKGVVSGTECAHPQVGGGGEAASEEDRKLWI